MKKRIWELDAFRGVCILGMLFVHILFDLFAFGIWYPPTWLGQVYWILSQWGGILFFLISGICVTLGSHPIRRGLLVFSCGLICTIVTICMYLLGIMGRGIIIYFGVLHCLGICMLLWPLMKKLPVWSLIFASAVLIAVGFWFKELRVDHYWFVPMGIMPRHFASSDYFPLLPNVGYFLAGIVLGKTLYRKKQSLMPGVNPRNPLIRGLSCVGAYSLPIYMLHQPLVYGLMLLIHKIF